MSKPRTPALGEVLNKGEYRPVLTVVSSRVSHLWLTIRIAATMDPQASFLSLSSLPYRARSFMLGACRRGKGAPRCGAQQSCYWLAAGRREPRCFPLRLGGVPFELCVCPVVAMRRSGSSNRHDTYDQLADQQVGQLLGAGDAPDSPLATPPPTTSRGFIPSWRQPAG